MTDRYLSTDLRRTLEKTVKDARLIAEEGARDAIRRLGVADSRAPSYLNDDEKDVRRRLRAHARALGDAFDRSDETQEARRLVEATAYAHWHRMLFARFLAERNLLRNPEYHVPVSLEDCRELAEAEGLTDPWIIAERYAASMLPGVFRIDDPVLSIELDPVQTQELHRLVTGLHLEVFQAEDSLGWTYQFWRAAEKDEVNKSGMKIGADELPAVTQLFTEPYMVRFLLHNTLGAWWAGKMLAINQTLAEVAADENELREACSLPGYSFDMLRFVREGKNGRWQPAAGTFPGWPTEASAITVLDPCCGSGHFLIEALVILTEIRQAEELLTPAHAVSAVLEDNIHGLEIDGRCVQIAAFSVALTAWRLGGWQNIPSPKVSWVGAPPPLPRVEFAALGEGKDEIQQAFLALYDLFVEAPLLGTLIEPLGGDFLDPRRMAQLHTRIEEVIAQARRSMPETQEGAVAARGMVDAAEALSKTYVLQITNVPFLGRGKQEASLSTYISSHFPHSKHDLASTMIERMSILAQRSGTLAVVCPQALYFLKSYRRFRSELLSRNALNIVVGLGSKAFETISGEIVNVSLTIMTRSDERQKTKYASIDLNEVRSIEEKAASLRSSPLAPVHHEEVSRNKDLRILISPLGRGDKLSKYASYHNGLVTGDSNRFIAAFWEIDLTRDGPWIFHQSAPTGDEPFSAMSNVVRWDDGHLISYVFERLEGNTGAWIRGTEVWKSAGIAVAGMKLSAGLYQGTAFDNNCSVVVPKDKENLGAIWAYCTSPEYRSEVRKLNQKVSVTDDSFVNVPFDFAVWQRKFEEVHFGCIPEPYSDLPTQWIFHGHPANASPATIVHVALARVCGYRWPAESDADMKLSEGANARIKTAAELPVGDDDGLISVSAVAGERPLADRLRTYLAAAFGTDWSDTLERRLIAEADEKLDKRLARDGSLEAWVRDRAFRQHCALFGQRPFLWNISDGLKDGFSVFAHYHRFDQANLRKLTYTLLGDWLARAKAENNALRYEKGRELQQELEKILEGEKPYDIFVRWKSLAQQPLGWDPDLDDGVRQNIRPFVMAGVLTHNLSKILKDKDRGRDVPSAPWYDVFNGERRNDHHTTLAEKRVAREADAERVEAAK